MRFTGMKEMKEEEYYTEEELDDIVSDHEALKEYLYGWDDAIKDSCLYKKKYVDQYKNR